MRLSWDAPRTQVGTWGHGFGAGDWVLGEAGPWRRVPATLGAMESVSDGHNGLLLVISGPSGVGKTTITHAVVKAFEDSVFSVSVTTRPKTDADTEGVDYRFVNNAEFERMVDAGELLEHAQVFDKRYGTPRDTVARAMADGKMLILEIDVRGALQVKEKMPDMFGLFVLPPSEEMLLERLRARGREGEDVIQRRFSEAKREISEAKNCAVYDQFIVNDDLDKAVEEAVGVVKARRELRA